MPKKSNLPIEVHDHFRKANVLHGYVTTELGEASQHALETGQELLAAKKAIPHGGWETECNRLFDGSDRTARSYMQFAKNMDALPKRQKSAVLLLEGSIDGAAKAAKKAAKPKPPKPQAEPIDVDSDPVAAQVQEAVASVAAEDLSKPAGKKPAKKKPPPLKSAEQEAKDQIKIWHDTIKRWLSQNPSIDQLREKFPGKQGDHVVKMATQFYESLKNWGKVIK